MHDAVIGLDAVTMIVSGKCSKQLEQRVEKRNISGKLYLQVDKTKAKDTYRVTVVLPSIIRPNNIQGFSISDSIKLEYVIGTVKDDLEEILGITDLKKLVVKKVEVNANKHVSAKTNTDVVTAFVARALLRTDSQQIEYCHGEHIKETRTIKNKVIDGFETQRHSSGRFNCKVYRKERQLKQESKMVPVFRLEVVYNKRGVSQALGKQGCVTLDEILNKSAMRKLIERYVIDVRQSIMPPIRLYLEDAVNLVLKDLRGGHGAYKTFLKRYDVIQYDYRIFRTAIRKFYKMLGNTPESASVQCSRIKAKAVAEGIVINEGVVKELEELFREIRLQKI